MQIPTFTYGPIPIELWEIAVLLLLFLIFGIWTYRIQFREVKKDPSYRYFLPGMLVKLLGGLFFGGIYVFYYDGGDTTSYYECALAFVNLFWSSPSTFFEAYFGGGTAEIRSLFDNETGAPLAYIFFNDKTRVVSKLMVPFVFLGAKKYFLATLWIALLSYGGLWQLYRMFVFYFPKHFKLLALAILFMPSVAFWGSGMLKDSITLAATCYFVVATNDMVLRKNNLRSRLFKQVISAAVILAIKPYIIIILIPATLVWYFYSKIRSIKNVYFRTVIVPLIYAVILGGSYGLLTLFGSSLGRFSLDEALNTAVIIQNDLKQEYYEGNSFDIGEFDATLPSIASKFPAATTAGLFRPYLWESRNLVMLLAGLENFFILVLSILALWRIPWRAIRPLFSQYPVLLYSFVFSLLFAFMIGITTSNFGALVRFKIPLIPLYMAVVVVFLGEGKSFVRDRKRRWGRR